jgi:hypothetical protein
MDKRGLLCDWHQYLIYMQGSKKHKHADFDSCTSYKMAIHRNNEFSWSKYKLNFFML